MAWLIDWYENNPKSAYIESEEFKKIPIVELDKSILLEGMDIPKRFYLMNNIKALKPLVAINYGYWIANKEGRAFLEENAPGDCDFVPIELWRNKKSASQKDRIEPDQPMEGEWFFVRILHRLEAVDWEHSEAQYVETIGYEWGETEKSLVKRVKFPRGPAGTDSRIVGRQGWGLTLRKEVIGGHQIWKDNFNGAAGFLRMTFASDTLKLKIEKLIKPNVIYIPAAEIG